MFELLSPQEVDVVINRLDTVFIGFPGGRWKMSEGPEALPFQCSAAFIWFALQPLLMSAAPVRAIFSHCNTAISG